MNQDRQQELARLEKELLEQDETAISDEELIEDIRQFFIDEELSSVPNIPQEPAFDDPQTIHEPDEPLVYRNFSNNYGEESPEEIKKEKTDRIDIGLMITASALTLGIIGILIYWLVAYLQ